MRMTWLQTRVRMRVLFEVVVIFIHGWLLGGFAPKLIKHVILNRCVLVATALLLCWTSQCVEDK